MAQITLHQPSRTTMRMIFELALRGSMLPATQADIAEAAAWHEAMWKRDDQAQQDKAAKAQQPPPAPPAEPEIVEGPPPEMPRSAVEEHGIASEEAQAKRDERRAKRLAEEAARKAANRAGTDN